MYEMQALVGRSLSVDSSKGPLEKTQMEILENVLACFYSGFCLGPHLFPQLTKESQANLEIHFLGRQLDGNRGFNP